MAFGGANVVLGADLSGRAEGGEVQDLDAFALGPHEGVDGMATTAGGHAERDAGWCGPG